MIFEGMALYEAHYSNYYENFQEKGDNSAKREKLGFNLFLYLVCKGSIILKNKRQ